MGFGVFCTHDVDDVFYDGVGIGGARDDLVAHESEEPAIVLEHGRVAVIEVFGDVGVCADDLGLVVAGLDGDDVDIEGFEFEADGTGKAYKCVLAGGIGCVEDMTDQTRQRCNIDDPAGAGFDHLGDDGAGKGDCSEIVGLDDAAGLLFGDIEERAHDEDARVVDEDVYGVVFEGDLRDVVGAGYVEAVDGGGCAGVFEGVFEVVGFVEIAHGCDDVVASAGGGDRGAEAETG